MFQNCVFCNTVDTRQWFKAAVIRALKTMAQAATGVIGGEVMLGELDWRVVGSAAVLAGITSVLTSVIGIPEVEAKKCSENAMASKSETKAVAEGTVDE